MSKSKKKEQPHRIHNTRKELLFLDQLGSFTGRDRMQCLKGYVETAPGRAWPSNMDGKKIIAYAKKLLKKEMAARAI